ncbi:MAG TPA: alpha/beta fold hydrolase [Methylovirgula sp.]|nr:alpha/beta fold hydrolase [Methylovirgula sp.]
MIRRLSEALSPWSDIWVRNGWRVQIHCATRQTRTLDAQGNKVASGSPEDCIVVAERSAPRHHVQHAVVLLHGIWDSPRLMVPLADALEARGWAVANAAYPSRGLSVADHGLCVSRVARSLADGGARDVSFIGFSLGGLVARSAMANAQKDGWNVGRLVLIGSPADGSIIAKCFQHFPGYRIVVGRCGADVTPVGAGKVPKPRCQGVMVIAGGTGSRGYNPFLPGDNDRLIAVEETRIRDYETEFLLVNSIHKLLPGQPKTISACCDFLSRID